MRNHKYIEPYMTLSISIDQNMQSVIYHLYDFGFLVPNHHVNLDLALRTPGVVILDFH